MLSKMGTTRFLLALQHSPGPLPHFFLSYQAILTHPQTHPCTDMKIFSFSCPAPCWSFPSGTWRWARRAAFCSAPSPLHSVAICLPFPCPEAA